MRANRLTFNLITIAWVAILGALYGTSALYQATISKGTQSSASACVARTKAEKNLCDSLERMSTRLTTDVDTGENVDAYQVIGGIFMIISIPFMLFLNLNRIRDMGWSDWMFLLKLVPLVSPIILILQMVLESSDAGNKWGPKTKGITWQSLLPYKKSREQTH